jgi:hypothetical protein
MTTHHTPGPWIPSLNPTNDHEAEVLARGFFRSLCVARCGHGDEAVANARLIASAPELLGLCEESLRALHEDDFPTLKEKLRAAITKAIYP